ncbi:MAG: TIGR02444 family protein [Alphaproteobacteria bacterium]
MGNGARPGPAPEGFWDFSLATYGREGVERVCLALQDRHGADVNLLLFCCWVGAMGHGALTTAELAGLAERVRAWREGLILPLRRLRRRLKDERWPAPGGMVEALRGKVKAVELEAEHVEQAMVEAALERTPDPTRPSRARLADAAASLAAYLRVLDVSAGADEEEWLRALLKGAFPEMDEVTVTDRCRASLSGAV